MVLAQVPNLTGDDFLEVQIKRLPMPSSVGKSALTKEPWVPGGVGTLTLLGYMVLEAAFSLNSRQCSSIGKAKRCVGDPE